MSQKGKRYCQSNKDENKLSVSFTTQLLRLVCLTLGEEGGIGKRGDGGGAG